MTPINTPRMDKNEENNEVINSNNKRIKSSIDYEEINKNYELK